MWVTVPFLQNLITKIVNDTTHTSKQKKDFEADKAVIAATPREGMAQGSLFFFSGGFK